MTTNTYAADRTALLIVDPYNDFMSEGGKLYNAIKETADASGMFGNLRKIIPRVRSAGIQIFIVPHHRSHAQDIDHWQQNYNQSRMSPHGFQLTEMRRCGSGDSLHHFAIAVGIRALFASGVGNSARPAAL